MIRAFNVLSEQETLALAISLEEEDARIFEDFADTFKASYPAQAEQFRQMRMNEDEHRHRLLELYREKFGEHIPLIRRHDVKGFVRRQPVWLSATLTLETARKQAELMEVETTRFYEAAARRATDVSIRQLLGDLAEEERKHASTAESMGKNVPHDEAEAQKRLFVLQVIQPGLAGLMDGSVSTLAPLFAAAYSTKDPWKTFLVGLAASIGAGISMGFAEALSDDGSMTGRGRPWVRGFICGLMTALGGLGHTFPYLIPSIHVANGVAYGIVAIELCLIAWVRHRFMESSWWGAIFQVVIGGGLVLATGILIGSS